MPELESLLLVLLVVYGTECLVWVPLGAIAFAAFRGPRFGIRHPSPLAGNQRGGIVVAQPFPPLGFLFMARQFPVSLSADGIFSFVASTVHRDRRPLQPATYFTYSELKDVRAEGKKVIVNRKLFLKAASTIESQRVVRVISEIAKLNPAKRISAIRDFVGRMFDTEMIEGQIKRFMTRGLLLRRLGNLLLIFLFIIAPAIIWRFGFRASGWPLIATLFLQTIPITFLFWRAHRQLFPTGSDERFVPLMLMLLAPASAIRAHDFLSRHALAEFHPLAVAKVLCPAETFAAFSRFTVADLRYPMYPITGNGLPEAIKTEESFRSATLEAAEHLAIRAGIMVSKIADKPSLEAETQSYCPRCGMQFVAEEAVCNDCGGRPAIHSRT
jgi:hypothetical protein